MTSNPITPGQLSLCFRAAPLLAPLSFYFSSLEGTLREATLVFAIPACVHTLNGFSLCA